MEWWLSMDLERGVGRLIDKLKKSSRLCGNIGGGELTDLTYSLTHAHASKVLSLKFLTPSVRSVM
jgi:hypothetical protein